MLRVALLCLCLAASTSGVCQRIVCYYTNWAQYRPGPYKFFPEDMDPSMCTHINYAFAKLTGGKLTAFEWNDDSEDWMVGMYARSMNHIKKKNPNAKLLLSVGGWNMGSSSFTSIVATAEGRSEFATTAVKFLRDRGFHGLDLDWEYPASRGSPPEDKQNYVLWLQEIDRVFRADSINTRRPRLLLTAATSAGKNTTESGYNVVQVAKYLDFVNVMTYDLNGAWNPKTGHNSPLYAGNGETGEDAYLNVAWAANHWVNLGLPRDKLVIGLPTYGRTFTLASTAGTGVGVRATGAGTPGTYTREKGFLSYYEICGLIAKGAVIRRLKDQKVPYLVSGNQWVGYDDATSLIEKVRFMKNNRFGGVMIWALDLDDFKGRGCGGQKYPLVKAIFNECGGLPHVARRTPVAARPIAPRNINRPKYRPPIQVFQKPLPKYRRNPFPAFQSFLKQKPQSVPPGLRKHKPAVTLPNRNNFWKARPRSNSPPSRSIQMFQLPGQLVNSGLGMFSRPFSAVQQTYQANPDLYHVISQPRAPPPVSVPLGRTPSKLSDGQAPRSTSFLSSSGAIAAFLSSRRDNPSDSRPTPDTNLPASVLSVFSRENSRPLSFRTDIAAPVSRPLMSQHTGSRRLPYIFGREETRPTSFLSRYNQERPRQYNFGDINTPNTEPSYSQPQGVGLTSIFSTRASADPFMHSPYRALARAKPTPRLRERPYAKSKPFSARRNSGSSAIFSNGGTSRPYSIQSTTGIGKPNTYIYDSEGRRSHSISAKDRLLQLAGIDFNSYSESEFNCIRKSDGLYPCPKSCKHFYTCVNKIAFRKVCANGLVYNPVKRFCDWPYNYKCTLPVAAPIRPGGTATGASRHPPRSSATGTAWQPSFAWESRPVESHAPVPEVTSTDFCTGRRNGKYVDPSTCANYIECVSHITYVMPCAQGTVYSQAIAECRTPANVPGCSP